MRMPYIRSARLQMWSKLLKLLCIF